MNELEIREIKFTNLDVPLEDNFTISQGVVTEVNSILVTIVLGNGIIGYGEITPFTELAGEDRNSCLVASHGITNHVVGKRADQYRVISSMLKEFLPNHSSVRCGIETGVLDAYCRSLGTPLWNFWGGKRSVGFQTDITIPIHGKARSLELAKYWYDKGFRELKMKVGIDTGKELDLITSIHQEYPEMKFIIDANQGFTVSEALRLYHELEKASCPLVLFEQPVHKDDLEGMSEIRNNINIPLAADESVFSKEELKKVIKAKAADIINLKIMKMGVLDAFDIAVTAKTMGLDLMIGGMIETRLAMGCSLCLVAGLGTINHLDLDTPLLMTEDPFTGGYRYNGPELILSDSPGLGISPKKDNGIKL